MVSSQKDVGLCDGNKFGQEMPVTARRWNPKNFILVWNRNGKRKSRVGRMGAGGERRIKWKK